jgi:hypothetical protein
VQFENFPLDVWHFKSEALAWGALEINFFSTIAIILTDFWGLFQRLDFNKSHKEAKVQLTSIQTRKSNQ